MTRNINVILIISILLTFGLIASATASDYYVDAESGDDGNDGSQGSPWKTITHALDSVTGSAGDPVTIHVAAGTYAASTNGETFPLHTKSYVSLSGEDRQTTILDAENAAYHVMDCTNDDNLTIEGFTITRGYANGGSYDEHGAGILCGVDGSPIIRNNIITGNYAHAHAAIYCHSGGSATIEGNLITENVGLEGGGVCCYRSGSVLIDNNIITKNEARGGYGASGDGGGIRCYESSPTIRNNIISGNTATTGVGGSGFGAGIFCDDSSPTIQNNTITNNTGQGDGGAIYCENSSSPTVTDSILWGDSPDEIYVDGTSSIDVTYSCIEGGYPGTGNTDQDPLFVTGHYYLSQTAAGQGSDSPCVDTGSDTAANLGLDDRTTRTDGTDDSGTVDMGYHYAAGLTTFYVDADTGSDSNDGSQSSPWKTITHALAAVTGTEDYPVIINVAAGTYASSANGETFPLNMEDYVSLSGEDRNTTILDAEDAAYHVIDCTDAENLEIEGLTITGGNANTGTTGKGSLGGGIFCKASSPIIRENIITGNYADYAGGGIHCEYATSPTIENNVISDNSTDGSGGGISCFSSSGIIQGNTICRNTQTGAEDVYAGGGIYLYASSTIIEWNTIDENDGSNGAGIGCYRTRSPTIQNNTITDNNAVRTGGGIWLADGCSPVLHSNTISGNSGANGGGAIWAQTNCDPTVTDSILWGDSPDEIYVDGMSSIDITYSCIEGGYSGTGNISDDPLFVTGPDGDYYLSQTAAGEGADSPCVDAGSDTAANLGLDNRTTRTDCVPDTGTVDMGYHYESNVYYVDGDTGSDSNDGSQGRPWKTITHALASVSGTESLPVTIRVAATTYAASTNGETFPLNMEDWVSLVGQDRDTTILDAESSNRVIYCDHVDNLTIQGFKITGGSASEGAGIHCSYSSPTVQNNTIDSNTAGNGGGIYCIHSSPTIRANVINDNTVTGTAGGGIYCSDSSPTIEENVISNNRAQYEGGIACRQGSSPMIRNNVITGNEAYEHGAGIGCNDGSSPVIENNMMTGNTATNMGGAIACRGSSTSPIIRNNTLSGNSAGAGAGIWSDASASPTLIHSILWGNSAGEVQADQDSMAVTYSCIQGGYDGEGNIEEAPEFVYGCYLSQTAAGQDSDSPCVDAGSDTAANLGMDDRTTRTDGVDDSGTVDMGYHFTSGLSHYYVDADSGDDGNDGSQGSPWKTITHALDSVESNGAEPKIIHAEAGTYAASTNGETFPLNMKSWVSLSGEDRDTTILDAEEVAYHVIYCYNVSRFTIESLTISRGKVGNEPPDLQGGGIYCCQSCPTIQENIIEHNTGVQGEDGRGGGIYCGDNSQAIIQGNTIRNNFSGDGGGIYCVRSSPTIKCNTITGNSVAEQDGNGGGILCYDNSSPTIEVNVISYNDADHKGAGIWLGTGCSPTIQDNDFKFNTAYESGGGIFCTGSNSPTIKNNEITHNEATTERGGGIGCENSSSPAILSNTISGNSAIIGGGISGVSSSSPMVINSILWGDSPDEIYVDGTSSIDIAYSCIEGGYTGEGNIDEDPLFISGPMGDYCLRQDPPQEPPESPCVDAGDDYSSAYGLNKCSTRTDAVPDVGIVDMGYHYPIPGQWTNDPVLTAGDVDPDSGTTETDFTFSIHYYDEDGDEPSIKKVTIDGTEYDMDGSGSDADYTYSTTLPEGEHEFYFYFEDGRGGAASDPEEGTHDGPTVNYDPVLSAGDVAPDTGTTGTLFAYCVHYYDEDGEAPAVIEVHIDGDGGHGMALDSGNAADGTYCYETTLGTEGDHTFHFECEDPSGSTDRDPEDSEHDGPFVNHAPDLSNGDVYPDTGAGSRTFTYSVDYYDLDGDAPSVKEVRIDEGTQDEKVGQMWLVLGEAANGRYIYYETSLHQGEHTFYFLFKDTLGSSARDPEEAGYYDGPTVTNSAPELLDCDVEPHYGKTGVSFVYSCHYSDYDDDYPGSIKVFIDGDGGHDMTLDDGPAYDGTYVYEMTLALGEHDFYFECDDGAGGSDRCPDAGATDGPLVEEELPWSSCTSPELSNVPTIEVTFESDDAGGSGVYRTWLHYKYESEGEWDLYYFASGTSGTISFEASDEGRYYFQTVAVDRAGNWEEGPSGDGDDSTLFDWTPPVSSCWLSGQSGSSWAINDTNTSPIVLEFMASDALSSIASVVLFYDYNGEGWTDSGLSEEEAAEGSLDFEPTNGEGVYEFYTIATDVAGNVEAPPADADASEIYDTTAPQSTCATIELTNDSPVVVDFTASDALCSVASVALWHNYEDQGWSDSGVSEGGTTGTLSFEPGVSYGTYEFYTIATDTAGNEEEAPNEADAVCYFDARLVLSEAESSAYCTFGTVAVTFTTDVGIDGYGGVRLYYRYGEVLDDVEGAEWASTSTTSPETSGTLDFYSLDGDGYYQFYTRALSAGDVMEPAPVRADTTTLADGLPPQTFVTAPPLSSESSIDVAFDSVESYGLASIDVYRWFGGSASLWTTVYETSGTVTFDAGTDEGEYRFYSIGTDLAGNIEALPPGGYDCSVTVDLSPPTSFAEVDECATTSPVEVRFNAQDDYTRVVCVELYYRQGSEGSWILHGTNTSDETGTFSFSLASEGQFHFYTIAEDEVGNRESAPEGPDDQTAYDAAPPYTSCIAPEYVTSGPIWVSFEAQDSVSGLCSVTAYYRFNLGSWVEVWSTGAVEAGQFECPPASGDGMYEFFVGATDLCGNSLEPSAPQTSTVYDSTAPSSSCSAAESFVTSPSVELTYFAYDTGSGVDTVRVWYRYYEGQWHESSVEGSGGSGTGTFTPPSDDGAYYFYSIATDCAGNVESAPSSPDWQVIFDRTRPELSDGEVSPPTGLPEIGFTFAVHFTDGDGQPPSVKQAFVDGEAHSMRLVSGDPAFGTYQHEMRLLAGAHEYYFYFEDAFGLGVRLPVAGTFTGPVVNAAPVLSGGSVSPTFGDTSEVYEFSVSYHDDDGDAASFVQVLIDGRAFDMMPATRAPLDVDYVHQTQLSAVSHSFYFICEDSRGAEARHPEAPGVKQGPTVVEFDPNPPYCVDMSPESGATDASPDTSVWIWLTDDISGVDNSTLELRIDGVQVEPAISTVDGKGASLTYEPPEPFKQNQYVTVDVSGCDKAIVPNCLDRYTYCFVVADQTAPIVIGVPVVVALGSETALIQWLTNERADSFVEFNAEGQESVSTGSTVMTQLHTVQLHGLSPNTTYRFRVGSTDNAGNGPTYSCWDAFRTAVREDTTPPKVLTGPAAADVSHNGATVIWTTDEPSLGHLLYSPMRRRGSTFAEDECKREHSILLQGLQSNTEYECELTCTDMSGNVGSPAILYFATSNKPDTSPPEIVEGPEVIYVDVQIALVGFRTDELCTAWVTYGKTDMHGSTANEPNASTDHEIYLGDLTPATEYHYQVHCEDLLGNRGSASSDLTFTTLSSSDESGLHCTSGPEVAYLTDGEAKIEWTTDKVSDTQVIFWKEGASTQGAGAGLWRSGRSTFKHEAYLTGLTPGTAYEYLISSQDPSGNSLPSQDVGTFRTQDTPDTTPPDISDIACSYNAGGKARIDWDTSEPSDSRIYYWKKQSRQAGKDSWAGSENTMYHSGWITGLEGDADYEYEVGSRDASGNFSWSDTEGFTASGQEDTTPPSFTYGPDVESRRGNDSISITWRTNEIATTVLEYYLSDETTADRYHRASYEHTTSHRVELVGLAPGPYEFEATSKDPSGNVSLPRYGAFTVQGSEAEPSLSNPCVTPTYGNLETDFTFRVEYRGSVGRAPRSAHVIIDGSERKVMTCIEGRPDDGVYAYTTKLASGTHTFRFEFESRTGTAVSSPATGVYSGPRVEAAPEFSLSLTTDKAEYALGEKQTVWLDASNAGDGCAVDLFVYLLLPDGSRLYWPDLGPEPTPIPILPFSSGASFDDYRLFDQELPSDLSSGDYAWKAVLCEHSTFDELCYPATAPFTITTGHAWCSIDLRLNESKFVPGDEFALSLYVTNPGDELEADLYVNVTLPDGPSLYLPYLSTEPAPMAISVPAGCENEEFSILELTLPEGLPSGKYELTARLCLRSSMEALSDESEASFELFNFSVTIAANGSSFSTGDDLTVSVSVRNLGDDIDLDLYIALMSPDGTFLYLPSFVSDPTRYYPFRPLLSGTEYDDVPILETAIPPGLVLGNYCFFAAFFEPDTPSLYGTFSAACWELRE